ncbi:UDP-N-acetylenolpyruvoylglucosamine reductase [Oxobacter pfennigii]|uniref:UDP-N-acetylenolpyruvoylglucosamine reductase n=1 Tax=Oxobacter pfennigii TaxID=36849 RepID=A0A0P9ADY3_9CLOT|nr:UDP-N-acetylmuramate dehydrogenase [Oxobacter pfennigii]KPU43434.1 UDP-N-acetylenolpyruvoylglucosamine reductase [Oxobacter pfennigii]
MKKCDIIERLFIIVGENNIKIDEPMKNHTSFKVGGPADIFISPVTELQIKDVLKLCNESGCPVFVMGNGTNLIVKDKGIRGVVLKIYDNFSKIYTDKNIIIAEAGALLSVVSKTAMKESLKGLEFASGIPGTVGGAAAMNAGAYNGEIKDVIHSVDVIDDNYNIITLNRDELQLGYRTSVISTKGYTVLRVRFLLEPGNFKEIKERIDTLTKRRKERQPLHLPSAGSTFKRPEGHFAAKLIEDAGLKGAKAGDAMVSDMHSGFIVNVGNATARDILNLIEIVKNEVYEKFDVMLEPEVKIVGEE